MSKEPQFKKYCENNKSGYCFPTSLWKRKLVPAGDGYIQVCPQCGWKWDPETGMTLAERNQIEIDACVSMNNSTPAPPLTFEILVKCFQDIENLYHNPIYGGFTTRFLVIDEDPEK